MKPPFLPVLLLALSCCGLVAPSTASGQSLILQHSITDLGTHKTASRQVDGLTITFPEDEGDVVDLLLPDIAAYRAKRQIAAREETKAVIETFSEAEMRGKIPQVIVKFLALKAVDAKSFDADYDAALKDIEALLEQWGKWSGGLSRVTLWNSATIKPFKQGERTVFSQVAYQINEKTDKLSLNVTPPIATRHVGVELIRPAVDATGDGRPFRLDLPLSYKPGTPVELLAKSRRVIIQQIGDLLPQMTMQLAQETQMSLIEALLQSQIRAHYFTPQMAATPEGAMCIRALARCYLLAIFKTNGRITAATESQQLSRLLYFDLPQEPAARDTFLRRLETLDPLAGKAAGDLKDSTLLLLAESRLVTFALMKIAQKSEGGLPLFQMLASKEKAVPEGGFRSVTSFIEAVDAAYGASLKAAFAEARAEMLEAVKKTLAAEQSKTEAAPALEPEPKPAKPAEPLPGRESKTFAGVAIAYPEALRPVMEKLGPEIAGEMNEVRAATEKRFGGPWIPPVMITDSMLEKIRGAGLEVTRDNANLFSAQAAMLANSGQLLVRLLAGTSIQVWFKDDLKTLLKAGRLVPDFSYNADTDKVVFAFIPKTKWTTDLRQPDLLEEFKKQLANFPSPAFPIILLDENFAGLKDVDAQVAAFRKDQAAMPFVKSVAATTPADMGLPSSELSRGGLMNPAQTLFSSVHELVEAQTMSQVIGSDDRRWFCEGLANLLAIRVCDQGGKPGEETGRNAFESLFEPAASHKRAGDVDLEGWTAVENESAKKSDADLTQAHYYFATLVMLAATEGRDEDFLKKWIAKIRETSWNRTNMATIIAAYDSLTGKSLREIMKKTVAAPAP